MMDEPGSDADELLLRWRQGRLDERTLYAAVREPMHQSARRGISSITSSTPDPRDVEEAVADAFEKLRAKDPGEVTSVIGLAKMIALRRGQDIGRKVVHEREEIRKYLADPLVHAAMDFHDEEVRAAEEDEAVLVMAVDCFGCLNEEQHDLVAKTIMGQENLSDWALRNGKSWQAASSKDAGQSRRSSAASRRSSAKAPRDGR